MHSPNSSLAIAGTGPSVAEKIKRTLVLRIISALVLAPVVLAAVYYGGAVYHALIGVMGLILVSEWANMVGRRPAWMVLGVIYITASIWALWRLHLDPEWGAMSVFWMLGVVWGADTGGYAFGMSLRGPKLAPAISPNKTWSGFVGGTALGAVAGWGIVALFRADAGLEIVLLSATLAVVSQIGDLFESWIKRRFNVKDSGNIIPGHGGLFDRVDGLVAVAIALALINIAMKGNVLVWLS